MKTRKLPWQFLPAIALIFAAHPTPSRAQEETPAETPATAEAEASDADVESLAKGAARFVAAFNGKDAAAIAALFLPTGEMLGRDGDTIRGREEIEARYKEIFAGESVPQVALEASSVRLVSPGVAIEDGVVHFTSGEDQPVKSIGYTATHIKQPDGTWLIASSRDQLEVTPPSEHLKQLAWLAGEWTYEGTDGVRTELAIDLDDSGNFLMGEAVATDADGNFQTTSLRIGWNPATSSVFWWTFDSAGGNAAGQWTRTADGWLVRTSGITADAETNAATQKIVLDGEDTIVWTSTDRVVAGESLPDLEIRFVRRAPDPDPDPDPVAEAPEAPEPKAPAGE